MTYKRSPIRWPGSKYSLMHELIALKPKKFERYVDPFLGSGVVFLNFVSNQKSLLSDINLDLTNFFQTLKGDSFPQFIDMVIKKRNEPEFYYLERSLEYECDIARAAQFYYLNRTCFNGLYRINSKGKFNVPFGFRKVKNVLDMDSLLQLKTRLKGSNLLNYDFEVIFSMKKKGDFFFIDPPYKSKVTNSKFLMYNEKLFSWEDQERLALQCSKLRSEGIKAIVTNVFDEGIFNLYVNELHFNYSIVKRYSRVAGNNANRGVINEYLFWNY